MDLALREGVDAHGEDGIHLASGRMEQTWNFAGIRGGGGILNVESLEDVDEIISGFPFAPFSEIDVYPLTDLHDALERVRTQLEQMSES